MPNLSGQYRLEISTASDSSAVSTTQECAGSPCDEVPKILIARGGIELGSKRGDRVIFPIELGKPGRIRVRFKWQGTARKLALILNGPDRPELPNPVAYYERRDGVSPITLSYDVTSSDFNRGRKWFVSLVNFSDGQAENGELTINYPREASPNFVNTRARLNDFVGNWQNVDLNTRGITRLAIRQKGNSLGIHSWGSCHPTDCDHGVTTVAFQGNPLIISREVSFKKEIRTLTMLGNGELRVLSENIFTDGTRRDYVKEYRFRKNTQSINLTGRWRANDGGTYYIRQVRNNVFWFGESSDQTFWTNVYHGRISGNRIVGNWADVPKGNSRNAGQMEIRIVSPRRLESIRKTGGFGGSIWTR